LLTNNRTETVARGASPSQRAPRAASRRYRRWAAGSVVVALLIAAVALGWRHFAQTSAVSYATETVSRGAVTRTVTATGTVNPELTIIVGSYVSGVVQSLSCDYNTNVKAGQVCAKIDPRPYQAALDQYTGQLARDRAVLEKDRTDLARYQTLASQNSIARQQAEDQLYVVHEDEGTVKLDESLVEAAKLNLGYTDIVSPVDGTVVSRNVTQGQTVAASFQTPTLFLIATDLKKMEVDTNTSESDIGAVKEDQKATFTVDAYPDRVFQGQVTQVRQSPQTVQNVVTYDAVVSVDNHDLALMPGMTASTQILVDQRADVLRVPDQALRYASGTPGASASATPRVFVMRSGNPVAVPVRTGLDDGTFSEVVAGDLAAGDRVVTAQLTNAAGGIGLLPRP
jgi:HlyD family secretion protein